MLASRYNPEDNADARDLYAQAIALDPRYTRAHANLALAHGIDVLFGWADEPEKSIRTGIAAAEEARRIDDSLPQIYFTLAKPPMASGWPSTRSAMPTDCTGRGFRSSPPRSRHPAAIHPANSVRWNAPTARTASAASVVASRSGWSTTSVVPAC